MDAPKSTSLALWIALAALTACGPSRLPDPTIEAIAPSETDRGMAPAVLLTVSAVYPFTSDYGAASTQVDSSVIVRIGGIPLSGAVVQPDGAITGIVPFTLPPASHDVALELADGRTAFLAGGFTVKPGLFPDAFTIDPIPDQRRGQPFTITLRGVGGRSSEFRGVVQIDVNKGSISPTLSEPFEAGVLAQPVTISQSNTNVVITVTDAEGHTGTSNAFRVTN